MLLIDKQTDKQTNATENITSLAEVINKYEFVHGVLSVLVMDVLETHF